MRPKHKYLQFNMLKSFLKPPNTNVPHDSLQAYKLWFLLFPTANKEGQSLL